MQHSLGAVLRVALHGADQFDAEDIVVPEAGAVVEPASEQVGAEQVGRHLLDRGAALGDRQGVLVGQRLAPPFLTRDVAAKTDVELERKRGTRSETPRHVRNGGVHARDHGPDRDDGAGADDHAQHREQAAQFVLPDGGERHLGGNAKLGQPHVSNLKASIGSRREACRAG